MSTVCVVGLGYIGLPVASMLASRGHEVIGYDVSERAVEAINAGHSHFFEPDLDMLLSAAVGTGRLKAQTRPEPADYFVIAVPTPIMPDKRPDMSYVEAATESIAPMLKKGSTVILESTSPIGTTEKMARRFSELRPDLSMPRYKGAEQADIALAHCPERILPGQMVRELMTNDRIIGGMSDACAASAAALYESFVTSDCVITDCRTAEFVKLVENSYRDVNIAFANELSLICDDLGIDVWSAISLANRHPRVAILQPGAGVGGHCIAVDPWFIVDSAPQRSRLIRTAREVNDHKPHYLVSEVRKHTERFRKPVVACFGIAYKPDVEDLRESPALEVVQELSEQADIEVLVCDPMVESLPSELAGRSNVSLVDIDTARDRADVVVFLVAHRPFARLAASQFLSKVVVDAIGLMAGTRQDASWASKMPARNAVAA